MKYLFTKRRSMKKKFAFTLAEVLITLAIIGVVTAITLPTLVQNYKIRSWKTTSSSFERKLGEALRVLNSQDILSSFENTKDFVENGLSKQMSIIKICDDVTDCFSDKIFKNEETSYDVSTLTDAASLGHGEFETDTVGVQFANGITALIAYNPYFYSTNDSDVVSFNKTTLNNREYVTITTNALSVVYDVSGFSKPNMFEKDLYTINSTLGGGENCTEIGEYFCIKDLGTNYKSISCAYSDLNEEYCPSPGGDTDYWAGAIKACSEEGLRLASWDEMHKLYVLSTEGYKGIPTSGLYIASSVVTANGLPNQYDFSSPGKGASWTLFRDKQYNALCVRD